MQSNCTGWSNSAWKQENDSSTETITFGVLSDVFSATKPLALCFESRLLHKVEYALKDSRAVFARFPPFLTKDGKNLIILCLIRFSYQLSQSLAVGLTVLKIKLQYLTTKTIRVSLESSRVPTPVNVMLNGM